MRADRRRGGRARARHRRARGVALGAGRSASCTATRRYLLQDETGQIRNAHSISAGLDYPGVGPEHALAAGTRARASTSRSPTTRRSTALQLLDRDRGHHPGARERARGRARDPPGADARPTDEILLVNLSGRGDKDMDTVAEHLGVTLSGRYELRHRLPARTSRERLAQPQPVSRDVARAMLRRRSARAERPDSSLLTSAIRELETTRGSSRARRAGADAIELGVPFSIRWPTVRCCSARPSARSPPARRCRGVLELVVDAAARGRRADRALRLLQPVLPLRRRAARPRRRGGAASTRCSASTCRPRRPDELAPAPQAHGLDLIALLAPTSTPDAHPAGRSRGERLRLLRLGAGRDRRPRRRSPRICRTLVRRCTRETALPVGVGFGVRTPEQAARIAAFADAVIVGSALARGWSKSDAADGAGRARRRASLGAWRAAGDGARHVREDPARARRPSEVRAARRGAAIVPGCAARAAGEIIYRKDLERPPQRLPALRPPLPPDGGAAAPARSSIAARFRERDAASAAADPLGFRDRVPYPSASPRRGARPGTPRRWSPARRASTGQRSRSASSTSASWAAAWARSSARSSPALVGARARRAAAAARGRLRRRAARACRRASSR